MAIRCPAPLSVLALTMLAVHSAAAGMPQPASRTTKAVEGWTVRVDDRLLSGSDADLGRRALRFLEAKLVDIKAVVPADKVMKLQVVPIVLDLNCGDLRAMQYHPSAGWLKDHGYSEDLAKCVHIPRAAALPTARNVREQPWVVLHELAHAYHDRILGFDEPRIRAAYETYKKSGHGDKVLHVGGRKVRHYALTDHKEFFAELTEAYFGTNDFFPFNRAELKEAEPEIYELMKAIWETPPVAKDSALRDELVSRMKAEQDARFELMRVAPATKPITSADREKPDVKAALEKMEKVDRDNLVWLKGVVEKHGWPGKSLVGQDGAQGAFLIAQHAVSDLDFMARCLDGLKAAYKTGDAEGQWVALMTDRLLVMKGKKKQLYGTQLEPKDGKLVPQPIEDEANVDARRKELGMPPLADYLKIVNDPKGPLTKPAAGPAAPAKKD
jgi:hypothetical protein